MKTQSPILKAVRIQNLLSFGEENPLLSLNSLNIREGGGISEWLWKGSSKKRPVALIEAEIAPHSSPGGTLHYKLSFTQVGYQLEIIDERIESSGGRGFKPVPYFGYQNGRPMISTGGNPPRELRAEDINNRQSVLSQWKDPDQYPELTYLGRSFQAFRLYRGWEFGINSAARDVFAADLPSDYLHEDMENFGLMLNRLKSEPSVNKEFLDYVRLFYAGAQDVHAVIREGRVQVALEEAGYLIPAACLSDGTLRWLALLTILLNPSPPPLVCIEEPELGLHPDMVPTLAKLLKESSERMQLIVTTHSAELIEEFTSSPESVVVCEKKGATSDFVRLSPSDLSVWLEKYSLGELWRKGEIGGNRW